MKKLLYTLLILIFAINSWAATYYVSTTDGNDSYDGLAQTFQSGSNGPWLTKAKVNSDVSGESDDVYFNRGNTWDAVGRLVVDWTGTSGDHVIIGAYGSGAKPIISNGDITLEIDDDTVNYVDVENLDLRNGTLYSLYVRYSDHVTIDSCDILQENDDAHVTRIISSEYFTLKNSTVTWGAVLGVDSADQNGVYLQSVTYGYIHNNVINGASHDNVQVDSGCSYIYIYENEIKAPDRGLSHPLDLFGDYIFVYRNYIHSSRAKSQSIEGTYHYIYNNVFIGLGNCCAGTGVGYDDCPENYEITAGSCNDGAAQAQRGGGWGIAGEASNVYFLNNYFGDIAEMAIKYYSGSALGNTYEIKNNIFNDCGNANEQTDEPPGSGVSWQDYSVVVNNDFNGTEQTWDIRNNLHWPATKNRVPPADDMYYRPADDVASEEWQIPTDGGNTEFNSADTSVPYNNLTASGNSTVDPDVGTYGTLNIGSPAIEAGLTLTTIANVIADGDIDDAIDYSATDFTDFVNTVSISAQTGTWNIGAFGNNAEAGGNTMRVILQFFGFF